MFAETASPLDLQSLLVAVRQIARQAGHAVMSIYESGAHRWKWDEKADGSPVTAADHVSEGIICRGLSEIAPLIPVVGEESFCRTPCTANGERFWLVDGLDGTREFLDRNGEFTINIGLIDAGVPVLGVVYAPAIDTLYEGAAGVGAFVEKTGGRSGIFCRLPSPDGLDVVGSRSHGDAVAMAKFLSGMTVRGMTSAGSSLKFCLVAEGRADIYPRLGRTMEWDTAAGHAVLLAAGGAVFDLRHRPLRYGKPGHENPHFYAQICPPR